MDRQQNPNLKTLDSAAKQLGKLVNEMAFLGGTATGLLITDQAAPPIRITQDIDAIVETLNHSDYRQLEKRLRKQGFSEDTSQNAPICRWVSENIILDILPTDPKILGFGNKWYAPAIQNTEVYQLPSGHRIKHVSAPYFLITKLEAFDGRGNGDYLMSHDIEDIIAVFDGRATIVDEVLQSEIKLIQELSQRFKQLLENTQFIDAISAHLPTDEASQSRIPIIVEKMQQISQQGKAK